MPSVNIVFIQNVQRNKTLDELNKQTNENPHIWWNKTRREINPSNKFEEMEVVFKNCDTELWWCG